MNLSKIVIVAFIGTLIIVGCTPGEYISSSNVWMRVISTKAVTRRFWITLIDQDGKIHKNVRLGGKKCRQGLATLPVGKDILVQVDRYRDRETHQHTDEINRSNLTERFCRKN